VGAQPTWEARVWFSYKRDFGRGHGNKDVRRGKEKSGSAVRDEKKQRQEGLKKKTKKEQNSRKEQPSVAQDAEKGG